MGLASDSDAGLQQASADRVVFTRFFIATLQDYGAIFFQISNIFVSVTACRLSPLRALHHVEAREIFSGVAGRST